MPYRIRHTADFQANGSLVYQDVGLDILKVAADIDHGFLDAFTPEVDPGHLSDIDALVCLTPRVTAASLSEVDSLALIARFGVGYDSIDVAACTEADVLLTITAGAVNYSVAESVITFMLALSHNLLIKDKITREGRWDERSGYMGSELRDRTLGIVGLGGIGARLSSMVEGFGMAGVIAYDPFISEEQAREQGAELVDLDDLMRRSDFVSINCPLNEATRNLIGQRELSLMKPTAYLINTARGGIVNDPALIDALKGQSIAGAALDCHDTEPFEKTNPIADLDNVIMAPHAIAWTNELFRDIGRQTCTQALALRNGSIPEGAINPEVAERPGFLQKLDRFKS